MGPGLLESVYEEWLCYELSTSGIPYQRQKVLPVRYQGIDLQPGYRLDLTVGNQLLVELKAVERLLPVHEAQVITYLKLSGLPVGLLVNFHTAAIRHGLRPLTNNKDLPGSLPC
jgi:GxxExxY protein